MKNVSNPQQQKENYTINFLTLGDTTVGKTSIILRYTKNSFPKKAMSTIGVDFRTKVVSLGEDQNVKIIIWDTAGQERFRNVASNYYHRSDCILLTFDISNMDSFKAIDYWFQQLQSLKRMEDIVLVLVGNKKDLNESRQVFIEDINKWKEKVNNIKYCEVSAFTGEGVTEMFNEAIKETIEVVQRREKEKENNKQTKDNKKMTNLLSGENENKKCC